MRKTQLLAIAFISFSSVTTGIASVWAESPSSSTTIVAQEFDIFSPDAGNSNSSQSGRVLTADAVLKMGLFEIDSYSCKVVPNSVREYPITFTDNDNQLSISAPPIVPMKTGRISSVDGRKF